MLGINIYIRWEVKYFNYCCTKNWKYAFTTPILIRELEAVSQVWPIKREHLYSFAREFAQKIVVTKTTCKIILSVSRPSFL